MYSREEVLGALSAKGYPLSGYETAHCDIPTEEILVSLPDLGNPRLYEGVPIICDHSPPDYDSLLERTVEAGLQNQIGYLLEGCLTILSKYRSLRYTTLRESIETLFAIRLETVQKMMRLDVPNEDKVLKRNMREEHFKWRVMGGSSYEQMEVQFRVYGKHKR